MKQIEKTKLTRERIISAAINEFGTKGYSGASLNSICSSEIPKGLIYHNYKDKDDLYLTCVKKCFDSFTEHIKKANIGSDLKKYMDVRLCYFNEHENEAHIFFDAVLQPPEKLGAQIHALCSGFDELNSDLYKNILSAVTLREGILFEDALNYLTMQQTMFNGYFSSQAFRGMPLDEKIGVHEAMLSKMLDYLIYGIAERKI